MNKLIYNDNYFILRENVLNYTAQQMNLTLENDKQVYIAVFDMTIDSIIADNKSQTLAMIFGLNTHLYFSNGSYITGLEKDMRVLNAMQSLLVSSTQVLDNMRLTENTDYYESENIRAYLKTGKGIYFKELRMDNKKDKFLLMLLGEVINAISKR